MSTRDEMNRTTNRASTAREDLELAAEDLGNAVRHTGDALRDARGSMEAGASGTLDRARTTATDLGRKAGHVAGRMAEAESDAGLRSKADSTTERALHKTADALTGAAPTVGRGVESALKMTGTALHKVAGPLGTAVGAIAGKVGGWWSSASDAVAELPEEEEQACRVHFESYTTRPAEMTFDHARTAYVIGHVAARNPSYAGRGFDEVEPDLRPGLAGERSDSYHSLRDFARYGYERGTTRSGAANLR
jgi:hypothetical protein